MPEPSTDWQDTLWRWWRYLPSSAFEGRLYCALVGGEVSPAARDVMENVSVAWGASGALTGLVLGGGLANAVPSLGVGWGLLIGGVLGWVGTALLFFRWTRRLKTWRDFLPVASMLIRPVLELVLTATKEGSRPARSYPAPDKRPYVWWSPRPDVLDIAVALGHRDAPPFAKELLSEMRRRIGAPVAELVDELAVGELVPRLGASYALTMRGAEAIQALEPVCTGSYWSRVPAGDARRQGLADRFWSVLDGEAAVPGRPIGWRSAEAQARDVIELIAEESVSHYAGCYEATFCPECLERFERCSAWVSPSRTAQYYACPVCRRTQGGITHRGRLVAVLDSETGDDVRVLNGELRANWLARARAVDFQGVELFDFDRVEILHATDEDVHHLLVDVANDTDEKRRKRYAAMECTVLCPLQPNTLLALGKVFGAVTTSGGANRRSSL